MNIKEFEKKVDKILKDSDKFSIYTTHDFQCDQTLGYPTVLNVSWDMEKAWLALPYFVYDYEEVDIPELEQCCADFGIRDCATVEDFNELLEELGDNAAEYQIPDDQDLEELM